MESGESVKGKDNSCDIGVMLYSERAARWSVPRQYILS